MAGRWLVLALLALAGCDDPARCGELRDQLLALIRTECPPGSSCKGNPGLDRPTVRFSERHFGMLKEMDGLGCAEPDLGDAPWFCNSGGDPVCPGGYVCCFESLSDICRRECRSADGGP